MAISEGTLAIGSRVILPNGSTNNSLSELNDVNISNVSDGQILVYDGTTNKWKNQNNNSIVKAGNPITFNTTDGGVFDKAEVEFSPIQDLHGYDKPWVGGVGKNIFPITVSGIKSLNTTGTWTDNAYELNGVTFTILTDSDNNVIGINVNGTASANTDLYVCKFHEVISSGVTYKMVGCPANGSDSTYRLFVNYYYSSTNHVFNDYGNGASCIWSDFSGTASNVQIRLISGKTFDNLIFKPMLTTDSTVTYATSEPYTNICPITGYTELNIFQSNGSTTTPDETYTQSLGGTYYGGTYDFATGKLTVDKVSVNLGSLNWIKVGVNKTFYSLQITDCKVGTTTPIHYATSFICSDYESQYNSSDISAHDNSIYMFKNDNYGTNMYRVWINDQTKSEYSEADFKTAMDGVQFVYELATPTVIDLTPTQISALVGDNAMWTDGDKVTVRISTLIDSEYVTYDNTISGLSATNVQDAIDELKSLISALGS